MGVLPFSRKKTISGSRGGNKNTTISRSTLINVANTREVAPKNYFFWSQNPFREKKSTPFCCTNQGCTRNSKCNRLFAFTRLIETLEFEHGSSLCTRELVKCLYNILQHSPPHNPFLHIVHWPTQFRVLFICLLGRTPPRFTWREKNQLSR